MAHIPKHRQLPDKENRLFKELLSQYEYKQYKKGLKAADTILKKFPNHGETIALKALTLHSSLPFPPTASSVGKQEEAEAMARLAVKKDITSHITWHVLGILAKTRKDWDEATRAFAMARKQDNDNIPLMRDSIALYLHTRQFDQAVAARHQHLLLRPNLRSSWTSLMMAHHLNEDPKEAVEVYDQYMSIVQKDGGTKPEQAQVLAHVIKMCMEQEEYSDALKRIEKGLKDGIINPRGEVTQLKAECLDKLQRTEESEQVWRELLRQNPDNHEYYRGLLRTKGLDITKPLSATELDSVLDLLSQLGETYPKSPAPKRLALSLANGEKFRDLARAYLVNGLEKGIPSLFVDVKGLYVNEERMRICGELVEEIVSILEKDNGLHDDDSRAPPTALLWAYYYLALHLSHPLHPSPSYSRSLELLETALKHTPTLPEIYMAKAMVLKRAGDPYGAAAAMEESRLLDGQDRFLNCKAAKYWLRAGEVAKAEELTAMFTKKEVSTATDLTDLQCYWFLQEEGDAHRRNGNLAMALKRYQALATVFQDYEDDQYDFHTYCMRRMTFSAYYSLMKYEDQLRSNPAYLNAAIAAIDIYIRIHDKPDLTEEKLTAEEEAERKKAAKKAQKAEQKARKAAAAASDGKKDEQPVPDADPNGEKLLKTETPLDDAMKLWKPLEKVAGRRIEVWTAGYSILIRKNMFLAALKSLLASFDLDSENPDLHWQTIHFRNSISKAELQESVKTTIDDLFPSLIAASTSSESFNESYLSRHQNSPSHIIGAARGLYEINRSSSTSPQTVNSIVKILDGLLNESTPPSAKAMLNAVQLLKDIDASEEVVNDFKKGCRARVPLAKVLDTKEEVVKQREEALHLGQADGAGVPNGTKADL